MAPTTLGIILLCVWALTNFWLLPLMRDGWKAADLRQKVARAGLLAVVEKVRDLAVIGTITLAVIMLIVWVMGLLGDVGFGAPKAIIEAMASVYELVKAAAQTYSATLGALGLAGAAVALFYTARYARRRVSEAWVSKANDIHARMAANLAEIQDDLQDAELQPLAAQLIQRFNRLAQDDDAAADAKLTEAERTTLRDELSSLLSMLAIEKARKELVLDDALGTPTASEKTTQPGLLDRVRRVLFSERFCKDLGLIRKPLSYVVTGLLLVTLIGWTAEPLATNLQLVLNNLRVNVINAEAGRELDAALSAAKEPTPQPASADPSAASPEALQATTRALVHAIARDLVRSRVIDQLASIERTALSETEFVRAAIAGQRIEAPEHAGTATRIRHEVAESVAGEKHGAAAMSHLDDYLQAELRPVTARMQRENPGAFARMAATLEARYAAPRVALDAQGELIARMLDEALGGIDVHPTTELGRQGQKLVKEFGKSSIKTWVNHYARAYVSDLIIGSVRGEVVARASANFRFEASRDARDFARELSESEGRDWVVAKNVEKEAKVSRAVASMVAQNSAAERLGGYDALFPHNDGAPSAGGAGGMGEVHANNPRVFAQSRATNFHLASRSFRVRGVLFGQDQVAKGLDVNDIRWTLMPASGQESTKVALEIRTGTQWTNIGSFDAAVVNQALRYAADRRVVATTITPGDGKIIARLTYLHPVLVDTPLGCRVVEVDRVVDTFTSSDKPGASQLATLAADRSAMWRWMQTVRLAAAVAAIPPSKACPVTEVKSAINVGSFDVSRFSPALESGIERFLTEQEKKVPGSTQFLRNAHACAIGELQQLGTCLCERVRKDGLGRQYWFPQDHTSQYREKQQTLTPDLNWLKRSEDRLSHVDLWVHTTFALEREARGPDEESATSIDFPAEELAALRSVVRGRLPNYVRDRLRSPSYDDFMAPLEDFVLMQRLMRAALARDLGQNFPAGKLIDLERATRKYVPYQPSIRWEPIRQEPTRSAASFSAMLEKADPEAAKLYLAWQIDTIDRVKSKKPMCAKVSN